MNVEVQMQSITESRARPGLILCTLLAIFLGLTGCSSTAQDEGLKPGTYQVEVTLTGGTGRASVSSPTELTVTTEGMTAKIVWSSPNYTWMEIGGTRYQTINSAGENSTFEIPVELDADIAISAETVAMSSPHVVQYTLRFDSATVKAAG